MGYDEIVILCFRTTNPQVLIVDGSSKTKCEQCGHDVWISPFSRKKRQELKAKVLCDVCQPLEPKPGEILDVKAFDKEQIAEIKDTLENRKRRN